MRRLGFVLALVLAACGGNDNNASNDDLRISELSPAEAKDLCRELLADISNTEWEGVARLACAFAEVFQEECSNSRIEACVSDTVASIKAEPAACDEVSDSDAELEACSVTVGELSACLDDLIEAIANIGRGLTCETFGNADLTPEVPASCQRLETACPGLIEMGGT